VDHRRGKALLGGLNEGGEKANDRESYEYRGDKVNWERGERKTKIPPLGKRATIRGSNGSDTSYEKKKGKKKRRTFTSIVNGGKGRGRWNRPPSAINPQYERCEHLRRRGERRAISLPAREKKKKEGKGTVPTARAEDNRETR